MKLSKSAKIVLKVLVLCAIILVISLAVPPLLSVPDTLMNLSALLLTVGAGYSTIVYLIPSIIKTFKS